MHRRPHGRLFEVFLEASSLHVLGRPWRESCIESLLVFLKSIIQYVLLLRRDLVHSAIKGLELTLLALSYLHLLMRGMRYLRVGARGYVIELLHIISKLF